MSNVRAHIIYGINFSAGKAPKDWDKTSDAVARFNFIETHCEQKVSDSGQLGPVFFGVDMCQIDAFEDIGGNVLEAQLDPTRADDDAFKSKLAKLMDDPLMPETIKAFVKNSRPTVYLTWSFV